MLMRKFNCHWNYYLSFTLPKLQSNLVNSSVNSIFFFAVFSRIIRAKFVKANDVIPLSTLTYSNLGELIVGLDRPWNGKDRLHIPLQTIQCAGWCWWLRISSELPNFLISQHRACCGEDQKIIWQKSRDLRQDDPRSKLQGRQNWKLCWKWIHSDSWQLDGGGICLYLFYLYCKNTDMSKLF